MRRSAASASPRAAVEICVLQQGDAQIQVRDPEVGFASKRLPKRRRGFVELELLEQGDAEIVRAIGLLTRRRAAGSCLPEGAAASSRRAATTLARKPVEFIRLDGRPLT